MSSKRAAPRPSRSRSHDGSRPPRVTVPAMPADEVHAAMLARWRYTATPNENHTILAFFEGHWLTETRLFWGDGHANDHGQGHGNGHGGGCPIDSTGEAVAELLFEGRFLQMLYAGWMAVPSATGDIELVEVDGLQTIGYDTYRNLYVGTWIDSMSTAIYSFAGRFSDGVEPVLTLYGQQDDPLHDVIGRMVKYRFRLISDQRFIFELYDLIGGHDAKVMEIVYTRLAESADDREPAAEDTADQTDDVETPGS